MLKKSTGKYLAAAVLALGLASPAFAGDYPEDITLKAGRGLANIASGWMELFKDAYNEPAKNGPLYIPVGLATGVFDTVGRTLVGGLDLATFFIPTEPLVQPLYIWNDFNRETTYGVR